jgi:prophage tail gpP-like protein
MAWKNPAEVARLVVNGMPFEDWTSVTVIDDTDLAYPYFQFECTEDDPKNIKPMSQKITPGAKCEIMLAQKLALTGYVMERQVGYSGREHNIMVSGTSTTFNTAVSSILPSTNGNYDGMSLDQLAKRAAGFHGVNVKTIGQLPGKPFEHMQHNLGELTYNFIERACRMRNVKLGTDAIGNLLLIGPHEAMPSGQLIEGKNILRAQCVVRDTHFYQRYATVGQQPGHDATWGEDANKGVAEEPGKAKRPVFFVTPAEVPTSNDQELKWRSQTSQRIMDGAEIQANITVQGWVQGNGELWKAREVYAVTSPMLLLEAASLSCKKITYDQRDGAGTTTTLEMVNPLYMNQHAPMSGPAPTPVVR